MQKLRSLLKAEAGRRTKGDKMTLEEVKKEIESKTGVPASLLNGETVEENIAQAKAMLAYKSSVDLKPAGSATNKSTKEQFADWLESRCELKATQEELLQGLEEVAGIYPNKAEASEANQNFKSTALQFAEFMQNNF